MVAATAAASVRNEGRRLLGDAGSWPAPKAPLEASFAQWRAGDDGALPPAAAALVAATTAASPRKEGRLVSPLGDAGVELQPEEPGDGGIKAVPVDERRVHLTGTARLAPLFEGLVAASLCWCRRPIKCCGCGCCGSCRGFAPDTSGSGAMLAGAALAQASRAAARPGIATAAARTTPASPPPCRGSS